VIVTGSCGGSHRFARRPSSGAIVRCSREDLHHTNYPPIWWTCLSLAWARKTAALTIWNASSGRKRIELIEPQTGTARITYWNANASLTATSGSTPALLAISLIAGTSLLPSGLSNTREAPATILKPAC